MAERLTAAQRRLTAAQARQRRAALGPPLDVDTDAAAQVSAADMPDVEGFVRSVAGQRGVDMLRAEREG